MKREDKKNKIDEAKNLFDKIFFDELEKFKDELSKEIKSERKQKRLHQNDFSDINGIKGMAVSRIENKTNNPKIDTVLKLLVPLGKTLYIGNIKETASGKAE